MKLLRIAAFSAVLVLVYCSITWLGGVAAESNLSRRQDFEARCAERGGYINETSMGDLTCLRPPRPRADQPKE